MFRIQNLPAIRKQAGQHTYEAIQQVQNVINRLSKQMDFDPEGQNVGTRAPGKLGITSAHGAVNIAIQDEFPVSVDPSHSHTIDYHVEAATDPGFANVVHHEYMGPARNKIVYVGNQTLYWRAYSQTSGSPPSPHTYFGGSSPVAVNAGGSASPAAQPYQGSGTSAGSGQGRGLSVGNRKVPVV